MGTFFGIICSFLFLCVLTEIIFGNWWIFFIVIGVIIVIIILGFIILSFVISKTENEKTIDTYPKEIEEAARVYADIFRVAKTYNYNEDSAQECYFFFEGTYIYIKFELGAPFFVREYYEGNWNYNFPYTPDIEERQKKACLKYFDSCVFIDKDSLWTCIMNRIISNNYENWCKEGAGEWAFEYPIHCPAGTNLDKFKQQVKLCAEKYIKGDTEAETDKPASQTASPIKSASQPIKCVTPTIAFLGQIQLPTNKEITIGLNGCDIKGGYASKHAKIKKEGNDWKISNVSLESRKSEEVTLLVNGKEIGKSYTELKNGDIITFVGVYNKTIYKFTIHKPL